MRLSRNHSIAVVVDTQERLFPHIDNHDVCALHMETLIRGLALLAVPTLLAEQYPKGLGPTIPRIAELMEGKPRFEKLSFSCCGEPSLLSALKLSGRRTVILCGIEAHVCVLQTALDLLAEGFTPVVAQNAVSSRHAADKATAIERMRHEGVIVSTVESLLFELLGRAGSETFKAISKLVK